MKLLLALLAVLTIAGCDDESVQNKVANVLEHGIVAGSVSCSGEFLNNSYSSIPCAQAGSSTAGYTYNVRKLQDGACFISAYAYQQHNDLIPRSDAAASGCKVYEASELRMYVQDGNLIVHPWGTIQTHTSGSCQNPTYTSSPMPDTVIDLVTQCQGYGFDTFDL